MNTRPCTKTTGAVLADGTLVEMVYDPTKHQTQLVRFTDGTWSVEDKIERAGQSDLVPYGSRNALIENRIVQFPSQPEPYDNDASLIEEIRSFIHRFVDLSETFEQIAAYYVLFSWVHDAFNELPYLRVRGEYGSGKTRFLSIIGAIAYKPIFGSGASTTSPIFHLLDQFGGTLVIDEADFRFSDEKADLVKILNNGNVSGFPVLRAMTNQKNGEISPRAFRVFGPKIIATRGSYDDMALESRFITEEMGIRPLRKDIPINLPKAYAAEALALRNKLLMFRFRRRSSLHARTNLIDPTIDARLNQVFVPLLSVIDDADVRAMVHERARAHHEQRRSERQDSIEARVLTVLRHLFDTTSGVGVAVGDVTTLFNATYGSDTRRTMTPRWMGAIIRTRLHLMTRKSHGRFIVPMLEEDKLAHLCDRFGVDAEDLRKIENKRGPDLVWEPIAAGELGSSGMMP